MAFTFSEDVLRDADVRATDLHIGYAEWVQILLRYSTEARLRIALPLLAQRNSGRKFTHRELAAFVGASREKVTGALKKLREQGEYHDEITRRGGAA